MTLFDEKTIEELLDEIIKKIGPYKCDHFEHAVSCLDHASKCAIRIKELLGKDSSPSKE